MANNKTGPGGKPRKPSAAFLERRAKGIRAGDAGPKIKKTDRQDDPTFLPKAKPRKIDPNVEADQPGFITSTENDKVKFIRLLQNKRERHAARAFLVEGVRLVNEAFSSSLVQPTYTVYEPDTLRKTEGGRGLLLRIAEMIQDKKAAIYPTTEKIIASVSDTVTPQGIAAAVPFIRWNDDRYAAKKLHLVLDGLQDPGNLGTILRSAGAAGNTAIWLTEQSVDVYAPKVVRAGMGAHFRVPFAFDQKWPELRERFEQLGIKQILLAEGEISEEGESKASFRSLPGLNLYEVDLTQPTALIIGNEAHGPGREAWQAATHTLSIPMPGGAESLNAAIAASLIMYEALRQQTAK